MKTFRIVFEDERIKVIVLHKATKCLTPKKIKEGYLVIQDLATGRTAEILKDKLIYSGDLIE